jgi:beta-glucosidase
VKGYFAWSFLDVFELVTGFETQYGLYRVDFDDEALPRRARLSAGWYSKFLEKNGFRVEENEIVNAESHAQQ